MTAVRPILEAETLQTEVEAGFEPEVEFGERE